MSTSRRPLHLVHQRESKESPREDEPGRSASTSADALRFVSPQSVEGRRVASRIIGMVASSTSSYRHVAESLGVSPSRFAQWADPADTLAAMPFGDVLGARPDFVLAVLVAALAAHGGNDPRPVRPGDAHLRAAQREPDQTLAEDVQPGPSRRETA